MRILIHGWYPDGKLITAFRRAYFEKGNHEVNLVNVNWLEGARTILYNVAKNRVKVIGEHVAKFIEFLVGFGGMEYSDLVVIGHSLGAHIAGIGSTKAFEHLTWCGFLCVIIIIVLFLLSRKKSERRPNSENCWFRSSTSFLFV